jgi:hypothetical protein
MKTEFSVKLKVPFGVLILILAFMLAVPLRSHAGEAANVDETDWESRLNYHAPPDWAPEGFRDQDNYILPSLLQFPDGSPVATKADWFERRRPFLVERWQEILGKLEPDPGDARWFGDITAARVIDTVEKDGYTRVHLELPIETDFFQPHLLLIPRGQGPGPFPAVIAWTSTTPDYTQPEEWWGAWLARNGYVVLTGWSFIRNYRGGSNYRTGVNELVYKRFGHWLPMAKMVHDVRREAEFLRSRPEVDPDRIGFMGFSLSAKTALYVGAFAPEISATVAIDPHIALFGATNYHDPWYLDWRHRFPGIETGDYPDPELRGTVWSLLDADPQRPGFERNHHELLALCAPRSFLLIGCSMDQVQAVHSDDLQSWPYFNRAREVYTLLGIPERLQILPATGGHRATGPEIDAAWQEFFERWLKAKPLGG